MRNACWVAFLVWLLAANYFPLAARSRLPPNVVLIFADDLGYGDLGSYGAKGYRTPHLDRLAKQGVRFTGYCVPQAVCSASRAALLTGCYPNRVGILGALGPGAKTGLNESEVTLAELLKSKGYATAIYGKWHLGDHPKFSPLKHGFDDFYGLPYSNDMWPKHPTGKFPDLPLIERERIVESNPDQTRLTGSYTERAVRFMEENRRKPFFLYLPHSMPHVPLFAGAGFRGRTERGLYGDVIEEIDDSVGKIVAALDRLGLSGNTMVIFTSDNGPWLSYGNHAGGAAGFREGKGTTFEGGVRVPCIVSWPGVLPRGRKVSSLATSMDWYPTIAGLVGAKMPEGRVVDGINIWPALSGRGRTSSRDAFCYYWGRELQAIRVGDWKLHFPHGYPKPVQPGVDGKPGVMKTERIELALYDLKKDPAESRNLARSRMDKVRELEQWAEKYRKELGDSATGKTGEGVRPAGTVE